MVLPAPYLLSELDDHPLSKNENVIANEAVKIIKMDNQSLAPELLYVYWEQKLLICKVMLDLVAVCSCVFAVGVICASSALRLIENRINLNVIVPRLILSITFLVTDINNLSSGGFALSFFGCQVKL